MGVRTVSFLVLTTLLLWSSVAAAQTPYSAFIAVQEDGVEPAFWWVGDDVQPTAFDLALMQSSADLKLEFRLPKTMANVSKIFRTKDLSLNNAKNLARTFGAERFFIGAIQLSPVEPFLNMSGAYARATLVWFDGESEREFEIERASFAGDEASAKRQVLVAISQVLARFAFQEMARNHADVGVPFESNDVVFEGISGKHFSIILGQLEKAGFPGTVVWATGGRVIVRFSKPVRATIQAVSVDGVEIELIQKSDQPLVVKTR